jgi:trehalose/maltose transport system substrate-binding protein
MKGCRGILALAVGLVLVSGPVAAAELAMVAGSVGKDLEVLRSQLDVFEQRTGHKVSIVSMPSSTTDQFGQYKLWLSAQNADVDVYRTDVIWAPQLADQFVDLSEAAKDVLKDHFPSIIESQTAKGKLVAMPYYTDAPALYYRKDLLDKYGAKPPTTWQEMADTAKMVMDKEREAGNANMWGYVFQGAAYEGLTCNALEWVMSNGGGQIVEADGTVSVNNPQAAEILNLAKGWIGTIAPDGVLSYQEEDARGVWQQGNAVFMRNWPYAYTLGNGEDSPIKGKFDVTTLPVGPSGDRSAATLGGWNLAVSKYSRSQDAAVELVMFLSSAEMQKDIAIRQSRLPTIQALYDDPEIAEKQPIVQRWRDVFLNAVPRPSAPTQRKYNEVSKEFWTAVHNTLSGRGTAEQNLAQLAGRLKRLQGSSW